MQNYVIVFMFYNLNNVSHSKYHTTILTLNYSCLPKIHNGSNICTKKWPIGFSTRLTNISYKGERRAFRKALCTNFSEVFFRSPHVCCSLLHRITHYHCTIIELQVCSLLVFRIYRRWRKMYQSSLMRLSTYVAFCGLIECE